MARANLSNLVVAVWEEMLLTSPDPFRNHHWGSRLSYRERLDAPGINYHGDVIPRIWRVRHNLIRLGNHRLDPSRLPV